MTISKHGGARKGAGRKKGSNQYGEPTKVVRIPESKVDWVKQVLLNNQLAETYEIPLYSHKVVAGFPSPAEDYIEDRLDLNQHLIRNKEATFMLRVQGDSMKNIGIMDGDILIVDKSIEPTDGKVVIAALDGELTVKRLSIKSTGTWLVPENDRYPPIAVRPEADIVIWGVVTATVSQF